VAVNGVCLTITQLTEAGFHADVLPETLGRTTLGALHAGDAVNLERALALGEPLGGHLMTGHVDATGVVTALRDDGNARWVTIDSPASLMTMIAEKGSVAVDGISLTVVDVFAGAFTVSLIPHTMANTTAGGWTVGSHVNLEVDLVARYVRRALQERQQAGPVGG
jgi:riboflavin synthase